jgi:hypothetical protein
MAGKIGGVQGSIGLAIFQKPLASSQNPKSRNKPPIQNPNASNSTRCVVSFEHSFMRIGFGFCG